MVPGGEDVAAVGADEELLDPGREGWGKARERREQEGVGVAVLMAETERVQSRQDRGVGVEREEEGDLADGMGPEEVWSGAG